MLTPNIVTFLSMLSAVGEYISLISSCLKATGLRITGHSIDPTKASSSSNVVFLRSTEGIISISQSDFTGNGFSEGGFF